MQDSMKFCNDLVRLILGWLQQKFAHIKTVAMLYHVHDIVVIGSVHFKPEHYKFWSYFKFIRNIVSGTDARRLIPTKKYIPSTMHTVCNLFWFVVVLQQHI